MIKNQKGLAPVFILILLLLAVVLGVYLVKNYTSYTPKADLTDGASLSLVPTEATYNRGCKFSIDINLDTAGHDTDGTDAIVKYDPQVINVLSVTDGTLYPLYPGSTIDSTHGRVIVSGLASVTQPMTGAGRLATLNLELKHDSTATRTELNFDFDPANPLKTNDTNIVENGTIVDVLKRVSNATINVGSGSGCTTGTPTPSVNPSSNPGTTTPKLESTIVPDGTRFKATVRWSGVVNPTPFDKIDLVFTPRGNVVKKTLVNWVYANTCTNKVPGEDGRAKSEGSCSFNVSNSRGEYQFRYYNNSAVSNTLSTINR